MHIEVLSSLTRFFFLFSLFFFYYYYFFCNLNQQLSRTSFNRKHYLAECCAWVVLLVVLFRETMKIIAQANNLSPVPISWCRVPR